MKSTVNQTMQRILRGAPGMLLASMIFSFLLIFLVQGFYYYDYVFNGNVPTQGIAYIMAFSFATLVQFCRLAFGVSGAYEFAQGFSGKGVFKLLFSLALTVWASFEANHIAHAWALDHPALLDRAIMFLQFLVWSGFVLEINLAVTLAGSQNEVHIDPEMGHVVAHQNGQLTPKNDSKVRSSKASSVGQLAHSNSHLQNGNGLGK